jgi:hypothetical protein
LKVKKKNLQRVVEFKDTKTLLDALCEEFKSGHGVDFKGSYVRAVDPLVSDKERVRMMIYNVWKVTGYRFM